MLNRRLFFGATAAVAAMAAPAVSVANVSADAALLDMGRQWEAAVARRAAATATADRLQGEYVKTKPRPPRLTATKEDCARGLDIYGGVGATIPWERVQLIVRRAAEWKNDRLQQSTMDGRSKWAERFVRADERHDAALRVHADRIGLTAADDEYDAAYSALSDLEDQIIAAPCSTLAGLRVKARVAKRLIPPTTDTDNDWHDTAALNVIDALLSGGLN